MSFRAPGQSSPRLSGGQVLVSLIPTQEHLLPQENQWSPQQASPGWAEWLGCHVSSPWGDPGTAEGNQGKTSNSWSTSCVLSPALPGFLGCRDAWLHRSKMRVC